MVRAREVALQLGKFDFGLVNVDMTGTSSSIVTVQSDSIRGRGVRHSGGRLGVSRQGGGETGRQQEGKCEPWFI